MRYEGVGVPYHNSDVQTVPGGRLNQFPTPPSPHRGLLSDLLPMVGIVGDDPAKQGGQRGGRWLFSLRP